MLLEEEGREGSVKMGCSGKEASQLGAVAVAESRAMAFKSGEGEEEEESKSRRVGFG